MIESGICKEINYVTNEEGKRVAVMIDLKKHGSYGKIFTTG